MTTPDSLDGGRLDGGEHGAAPPRAAAPLTRREALAAVGTMLTLPVLAAPGVGAAGAEPDAFHDPTYSVLRRRAYLVDRLTPAARQAQDTRRLVRGIRVTGLPESLPELDDRIADIMTASGVPGVSLALARNNELLVARGYGRAGLVGDVPVEPTMPATIMSVSKTVTATAALTLVRDGKLELEARAFRLLQDALFPVEGASIDPRQYEIEIRHLMSHTSGLFNNVESLNDPSRFESLARRGAIRLVHGRVVQNDLVRIGMEKRLLFSPGQKYAYSGQGIQVLGRIVEKVSGLRLDRYIQKAVFDPLGIRSYYVGSYLDDEQYAAFERPARDHLYAMSPCVYDKARNAHRPRDVPRNEYVSWGQADACGWGSMNSLDLLRYVSAVPELVGPQLWSAMTQRAIVVNDAGQRAPGPFGLGFAVTERGARKGINHNGEWPGERSFVALRPDGGSMAVLVNSDDVPRVHDIIAAAGQFLDRLGSLKLESPRWQDYGYLG
jgi:CubicO group peptidase (beta-lactamase class C family)